LSTLETVGTETPAAWAIFEIVIGVDPMLPTFVRVSARPVALCIGGFVSSRNITAYSRSDTDLGKRSLDVGALGT
jgi:hypothetical protein